MPIISYQCYLLNIHDVTAVDVVVVIGANNNYNNN